MERTSHPQAFISTIRNDVQGGVFQGRLEDHVYRKGSRNNFEKVYKLPHFKHPYANPTRNPMTAKCSEASHQWLVSYGIDKELGPVMWEAFVKQNTPELVGWCFPRETDHRAFFWLCKLMALMFAVDTKMDESDWADSLEKSCDAVLDMTLVLLWNDPENKRILDHMQPVYELLMAREESRSRLLRHTFNEDLLHARNKSKSLMDIKLGAFGSALRDQWVEYQDMVPADFVAREAECFHDFYLAVLLEANNRKSATVLDSLAEYFELRRKSAFVLPFIICTDMLIAVKKSPICHIPNSLIYGAQMQSLLTAINDVVAWHNDIIGFQKEIEDEHNIVKVVANQYNCQSYTEAGALATELLLDRVAEMEVAYEQLKSVSSVEFHPAIDLYMETCRNWVSGTHQWHMISLRYNVAEFQALASGT